MNCFWKYTRFFFLFTSVLFIACTAGAAETGIPGKAFDWKKAYFFNFYDVFPLSSGDVWVVGSKGMICAYDKAQNQWFVQEAAFSKNLYSVSFPVADKGWIAGQNGTILHTEDSGKTWVLQPSETTEHLFSLFFTDQDRGWAVGSYGTILYTSNGGKYWRPQGDQVDRIYNGVFFTDPLNGWIVGEFGVILHTKNGGVNWQQQENPLGEKTLFSVFFVDALKGYACGMDGEVIATQDGGETWHPMDSGSKENLFSINVRGNKHWAVGLKGTLVENNNGGWQDSTEKIPTRAWLKKCVIVDEKIGWIVGSVGTVLRTTDGGDTWMPAGQGFIK